MSVGKLSRLRRGLTAVTAAGMARDAASNDGLGRTGASPRGGRLARGGRRQPPAAHPFHDAFSKGGPRRWVERAERYCVEVDAARIVGTAVSCTGNLWTPSRAQALILYVDMAGRAALSRAAEIIRCGE